jgi:hypothetical protein
MFIAARLLPILLLASATPSLAVTLGPLRKSGITDGPGKAFYLSMANPYPTVERFVVSAVGVDNEEVQPRVTIYPADSVLGGGARRQLLVIVRNLSSGERYSFRVCAMRRPKPQETIYARACSTLTARRLAARS